MMIVEHCQSLENLHALLTHPLAMVITDGVYTQWPFTPTSVRDHFLYCWARWCASANG